MANYTIAIDAMGGDHGPRVTVPAALKVLRRDRELSLILVGDEVKLKRYLKSQHAKCSDRLTIHHAPEVVEMDELPSSALRNKKKSSMRLAINLVKEGVASACVSAGNTGALMATARFVLKTLPGIDRPAIISVVPTQKGTTRLLDLGANVDSCAEHLVQFAVMGSAIAEALENKPRPKIGLLNIGVEEIKGNDQVKRTGQLLQELSSINYVGFVEGNDIFTGDIDVVVCDGFVGNVALKSSEGLAKLLINDIKRAFTKNVLTKCLGLIITPIFKRVMRRIDPARYNGASFIGLNGIVVKSHGSATLKAFQNAIIEAKSEVQQNIPEIIGKQVAAVLNEGHID